MMFVYLTRMIKQYHTVRDKDVKDVKQMILGQDGTSVTLSLSSPPDAPDKLRTLKQACRMHQEATIEKIK